MIYKTLHIKIDKGVNLCAPEGLAFILPYPFLLNKKCMVTIKIKPTCNTIKRQFQYSRYSFKATLLLYCLWLEITKNKTKIDKNDIRFVFTSSCLQEGSCLIYVICACLCIVVFNTYCAVVFFFLCTQCCQFLWIVIIVLPLRYSLAFIYIRWFIR